MTAVEGETLGALDLEANAVSANSGIVAVHQPVENFTRSAQQRPDTIILDPPRTGVSREALDGIVGLRAGTIIYVSCDVATLARDSRRLIDAVTHPPRGRVDLFPNTAPRRNVRGNEQIVNLVCAVAVSVSGAT